MASELTEEEKKAVEEFVSEIDKSHRRSGQSISWHAGCKFLMARKFDLKRALELYTSHQSTREREDLLTIEPNDPYLQKELSTEKFTILPGKDNSGAAVALFCARVHLPPQSTHQVVLKALIYQLDTALESLEIQRNGIVFVYDMSGSKYANFDYELSIKILNLLKGAYPARLKRVLIVTAPLWFKAPFKILRLFVKEKLRDRVSTVGVPELKNFFPLSSLPRHLGGTHVSCHSSWIGTCNEMATSSVRPDLTTYFHPVSPTTLNYRSPSSSFESESSKDTVNEKHTTEDKEKDDDDDDECLVDYDVQDSSQYSSSSQSHNVKDYDSENIRTRKRKTSDMTKKSDADGRRDDWGEEEDGEQAEDGGTENTPRKKRPPSSGSNSNILLDDTSIHSSNSSPGMDVTSMLAEVNKLKRKGLFQQYASIKMEAPTGTFTHAKNKLNTSKNRYTDVLCYDHSRVVLPCEDEDGESTDYINANFVDGYMQKNAFISTQGPLPRTFSDFWHMVWNYQVCVIIMTTRVIERSRMKCGQYWPLDEETDEEAGHFIVYNDGVVEHKDYRQTKLLLHNTQTGESREVTHLQFISWPDYGVPPVTAFVDFLFHVREVQAAAVKALGTRWTGHPLGPPQLIHCSAGIGRTGSFITVDICLRRLEQCGTVDVQETVRRVRSQRAFSIQMPDQYVFCHLAILEHAYRMGLLDLGGLSLEDEDSDSDF